MNVRELEERLAEEGCNPSYYAVGARGAASDAYCLTENEGEWRIFYTERGSDSPPIFESTSEEEACRYFFDTIMKMRHDHCVGFFRTEQAARDLATTLAVHGVESRLDRIPYGGPNDPRYRVFVTGRAIFTVRDLLGTLPVED